MLFGKKQLEQNFGFPKEVVEWANLNQIAQANIVEVRLTIISGSHQTLSPKDLMNLAHGVSTHLSNPISQRLKAIVERNPSARPGIAFMISGVNGVVIPALGQKIITSVEAGLQMGGIDQQQIPKLFLYTAPISMILTSDQVSGGKLSGYTTIT